MLRYGRGRDRNPLKQREGGKFLGDRKILLAKGGRGEESHAHALDKTHNSKHPRGDPRFYPRQAQPGANP